MTLVVRQRRRALSRVWIGLALAAAGAALFAGVHRVRASSPFFTPGNLIVYRVGTGSGSLVNTGNPVFLDEYTPAGRWYIRSRCRRLPPVPISR